jgi:hypothetical protein
VSLALKSSSQCPCSRCDLLNELISRLLVSFFDSGYGYGSLLHHPVIYCFAPVWFPPSPALSVPFFVVSPTALPAAIHAHRQPITLHSSSPTPRLTFSSVPQALRDACHCIAQTFAGSGNHIPSCVSDTCDAFANCVGRSTESVAWVVLVD